MPFGRRIFATGGNPIAARFSGVRTDRTKIAAFVISGVTASLAGMMLAARSTAGNPSLGAGLELDVIAAVIIGGTSLFGGYGSIVGSVVGAIFIGILGFGLLVMGLSTSIQEVAETPCRKPARGLPGFERSMRWTWPRPQRCGVARSRATRPQASLAKKLTAQLDHDRSVGRASECQN
jgi:hypothetical protein